MTNAAEWNNLYDRYYRKRNVYDMLWNDIDLEKFVVAGAPFGGPIALVRDERKILLLGYGAKDLKPTMRIFTSAGKLISPFAWKNKGLVRMGWTAEENLVCVLEDGNVNIYSIHGELIMSFLIAPDINIAECHIWPTGLACRTAGSSIIYAVTDFKDPHPQRLADAGLTNPPTAMAVIEPRFARSGKVEVLLANDEGSVIVVDENSSQDQAINTGPFTSMAVSPAGGIIACFNSIGTLYVVSTDFQKNLSSFETKSKAAPLDLVWCGEDSVVLYWDKILLMVGPYGDYVKYAYNGPLNLVPECDGVRVISNKHCEFLQRVPQSTEEIFRIGSVKPTAYLYDAAEAFESKSAKADEKIRLVKADGELEGAIENCMDAAAHEFDIKVQKKLLRAASYGKLFVPKFDPTPFVDMCQILRVINAVREINIGIPLTYQQYQKLTTKVLIDRLVNRHHHLLAIRICEYLRMKPDRVLVHWACAKIAAAEEVTDTTLAQIIMEKLESFPHISFAEISRTAFHARRAKLATMLLEYEPRASDQVPLLIGFKEDELALKKAIESGDTDLVYLALLHLKQNRETKEFLQIIIDKPLARNLLISYCKLQDQELLKHLYYHTQTADEAAAQVIQAGYSSETWTERKQGLELGLNFYKRDKQYGFAAQMTKEQMELLEQERSMQMELKDEFVDKPVNYLIEQYISHNQYKKAKSIKKKFSVPDRRFWHILVRTYSLHRLWPKLEELANSQKRPAIGYLPFVEACIDGGNEEEAVKYIRKLPDPADQLEWLCNLRRWKEATEVAVREKDAECLEMIRANCKNRQLQEQISQYLGEG